MPEVDDLDPEIRLFAQRLAAGYAAHPSLEGVDLATARAITEAVRAPFAADGPAMARTEEHVLAGNPPVRLRVHRPLGGTQALPALAYLHGGGWVFFSLDTHDRLMRELAARSGRTVIGIDYARAPETRFPVALEQTVAALRWLHAHAADVAIDPTRLAVGGDSAGANLALAAATVLRDAGDGGDAALLQGLLLNYGVFGDDDGTDSFTLYDGPRYTLGKDEMRSFWQQYLRDDQDRHDPRAQPLRGRLDGLPPALLVVAECDVLRDNSLVLAERLAAAGATPTLRRYAGVTHSFLEAMSFAAVAARALDDSAAWLRALPSGGAA